MSRLLNSLRSGDWLTLSLLKLAVPLLAGVTTIMLAVDFWLHTRFGVVDAHGEQIGRDFVNYWAGARLAIQGHAGLAYDLRGFLAYERSLTAPNAEIKWYGYPPVLMVLCAPLGMLGFLPAFAAWTVSSWAILARMLAPRLGGLMAGAALLAMPAFYENALSGQNGAFSAIFLAGGLVLLDRRPLLAGVLFGLLCYKPHLGVLIPVALIASGRWRTALAAGAAAAVLIGASMLLLGWQPWAAFLHNAPIHKYILETARGVWARMPSVYLTGRWLGVSSAMSYGMQGLSALGAALAVFMVWRTDGSTPLKSAVLAVATFLVTPYAWDYDMVVLLFAAVWLWGEAERTGWRAWEKTTLTVLLLMPWFTPQLAVASHLQLGPLVLWAMLGLLTTRALPERLVVRASSAICGSLVDLR